MEKCSDKFDQCSEPFLLLRVDNRPSAQMVIG